MRDIVTYTFIDREGKCEADELLREGYPADIETLEKIHPNYRKIEIVSSRKMEY